MGSGLELQVTPCLILVEMARQRALDIARTRVVALYQVAVVGVHDADEIREICRRAGVKAVSQHGGCGGKLRQGIRDRLRCILETGRFYPLHAFFHGLGLADLWFS
ncbi:hypothetical protein LB563_23840 [Mesorhizobium sp. CO1-1-4]|nr:hypothetical protein [Mesorhizobium sp. CO1-1-4]MBZ9804763.1 hypothetical protein [Mesorhizobium sp. ES1-6]